MSDKLTLTLGLRFDYQFARTESDDQYSTFDPNTPNPGAGNIPGALIFAGSGPGRTGSRKFEAPDKDAWGPRAGFAYRLGRQERASAAATGSTTRASRSAKFVGAADARLPGQSAGPEPDQRRLIPRSISTTASRRTAYVQPPFIDPTFANGTAPLAVAPNGLTLPRFQNWSVTYQRQLTGNMMLDVSYIGNHGSRLNHHCQTLGVDANMNDPSVLALGATVLQSNINSAAAQAAGITSPYPGFTRQRGAGAAKVSAVPEHPAGAACRRARVSTMRSNWCSSGDFSRGLQARVGIHILEAA